MEDKDTEHPRADDRNEEVDESPAPDPEERQGNVRFLSVVARPVSVEGLGHGLLQG